MFKIRDSRWRAAFAICLSVTLLGQAGVLRGAETKPADLAGCLASALKARASNDLAEERRLLEHAETLQGSGREAAEVQRHLARLDWQYNLRFDAARERLGRAANGPDPAEAWLSLARLECVARNYDAAATASTNAVKVADSDLLAQRAQLALARSVVLAAMDRRRNGEPLVEDALRGVLAELLQAVSKQFGHIETARVLVRAALLLDDGEAALLGWRSYYHVASDGSIPNAIAEAGDVLQKLLPEWAGVTATAKARIDLVGALGDSRFFEEAELVAIDPRAHGAAVRENPRVHELVAYSQTIRRLRKEIDEFYRKLAFGKARPSALDRILTNAWNELWPELHGETSKKAPRGKKLQKILAKRFGADYTIGNTGGYYGIHMGHTVIDETRLVEQYGFSGDMRFIALDNMVSNGFWTWLADKNSTAGWATPGTMREVRPATASLPLMVWQSMHSEKEREEFETKLVAQSKRDERRAIENPHAFLPGLQMRLQKQGMLRILHELRAKELVGEELRKAFIAHVERAFQESSIFAHEGRHVIDKLVPKHLRPKNPEYTAKLSEVAFAREPRLALSKMIQPSIGGSTNHGKANLEVMKGIVRWMSEHPMEIQGLDSKRPLLPQADLLTDEQIRGIFRGLDPLAKRK